MLKTQILVLLFVLCSSQSSCVNEDVIELSEKLYKIMKDLSKTVTLYEKHTAASMITQLQNPKSQLGKVMGQLNGLMKVVNGIKNNKDIPTIRSIIKKWGVNYLLPVKSSQWKPLQDEFDWIDLNFDSLWRRITREKEVDVDAWKLLSKIDLKSNITTIERIISGSSPDSSPNIPEKTDKGPFDCIQLPMRRNALVLLFRARMIIEIKARAFITYAFMIQSAGWRKEVDNSANFLKKIVEMQTHSFGRFMDLPSDDMKGCEPVQHGKNRGKRRITEMSLERMAVAQYQKNISNIKTCSAASGNGFLSAIHERDQCHEKLVDCQQSHWLQVCRLNNGTKRYSWIRAHNVSYGENIDQCLNGNISLYNEKSLNTFCICQCHNKTWISLNNIMTSVRENMVITGLRFVQTDYKHGSILHLQVKQGKLLANGQIDPSTDKWIPLSEKPELALLSPNNKKFYFDQVLLPPDFVAVGVGFKNYDDFSIVVTGRKFNYLTGKILPNSIRIGAERENYKQSSFRKKNRFSSRTSPKRGSNRPSIELQISNVKSDVGQSMRPYFDLEAVETKPPLLMGGIGISRKDAKNSAEIISPKLYPFNFGKSLKKISDEISRGKRFLDSKINQY